MCDQHGMFHEEHARKGKRILKLTAEIVETYLQIHETPPSLDELQTIIRTVFATLKECKDQLKDQCKE